MKRIQRAAGFFSTVDEHGNKVEGETRGCAHCGRQWVYMPHDAPFKVAAGIAGGGESVAAQHKKRRGVCMSCYQVICAESDCMVSVPCPRGASIDERIGLAIERAHRDSRDHIVTLE